MVACMMVSVRGSHKHLPQLPGISYVGALETSKALSQILRQNSQHYWVHLKHDEIHAVPTLTKSWPYLLMVSSWCDQRNRAYTFGIWLEKGGRGLVVKKFVEDLVNETKAQVYLARFGEKHCMRDYIVVTNQDLSLIHI